MTVNERIRDAVRRHPEGLTANQIAVAIGRNPASMGSSVTKAVYGGVIEIAHKMRHTRFGGSTNVYVVAKPKTPGSAA